MTNYFSIIKCRFKYDDEEVENPHYCPECSTLLKSTLFNTEYYCPSSQCSFSCSDEEYNEIINEQVKLKKEEYKNEIKEIFDKARKLEKDNINDAITYYNKIENNYDANKRLCICYRRKHYCADELNVIFKSIHNNSFTEKEQDYFKKRLKEFNFETKKSKNKIKVIKSNKKCPECGKPIILKIIEKRNNIKYISCSNSDCYWFGGVFKGEIKDFEKYML